MKIIKQITLLLFSVLSCISVFAQENKVDMADKMRSNGRIYVVVAVVLTILIGLILYVIKLERKINKLEKETK